MSELNGNHHERREKGLRLLLHGLDDDDDDGHCGTHDGTDML